MNRSLSQAQFGRNAAEYLTSRPHAKGKSLDRIPDFLDETRRVLKRGGTFAVVDNVGPTGSVGDYINAFERFRDPSHLRARTVEEWRDALIEHGFDIAHEEVLLKEMEFASW